LACKVLKFIALKNKLQLKVFEAFAGYGGASFGLQKAKIKHEVVGYSEIHKLTSQFYELNHPGVKSFGDITKIDPKEIPDFDLFTGGFPCQPFSMVGMRKGVEDTRGTLFHDIIRICDEKRPKHVLLENVKGLKSIRGGSTLKTIISELTNIGYDVICNVLNSKDYGIPQNRERIWIYGIQGSLPLMFNLEPPKEKLTVFFKDLLDKNPDKSLFKNQEQIKRLTELYGLDFIVNERACVDLYNKNIRKDGISITILEPHHNKMRVVHPPKNGELLVRKYSVEEHFKLMGFTDIKLNYGDFSYSQLGKMAANGWDINLVAKLYKHIFKQIEMI
jgi:DNA (cytosine-5)-methyltransferase 1